MNLQPTELKLVRPEELHIRWSDQVTHSLPVRLLRDRCPCATCRERRLQPPDPTSLPVLRPEETRPLHIVSMRPVGNYAYAIQFSDGHDTGIYTLDFLRELGTPVGS
jgi:DUF971 family protein